jgi:hypothetical protein
MIQLRTLACESGTFTWMKAICQVRHYIFGVRVWQDRIPWYWEDNRAFLRAYENLGGCYLDLGDGYVDKALDTFQQLLMLNPDDFGVSDLVHKLRFLSGNEITDDSDSSSVPQP